MIAPVVAVGTQARAAPPIYRPVLRAMSQTGAASLASGLLSAVATKIMAAVGGPAAVATLVHAAAASAGGGGGRNRQRPDRAGAGSERALGR